MNKIDKRSCLLWLEATSERTTYIKKHLRHTRQTPRARHHTAKHPSTKKYYLSTLTCVVEKKKEKVTRINDKNCLRQHDIRSDTHTLIEWAKFSILPNIYGPTDANIVSKKLMKCLNNVNKIIEH